jgi:flagellar assembly protein FliH
MTRTLPALRLREPLRDVRPRTGGAPAADFEQRAREREAAAYERGRCEGEKALSEQLVRQRAELHAVEKGVLESLRQAVPQVVRDTEHALTALALEVAQRLVAGLPVSVEMIEGAIREALAQVEESTEFHLYLHPEDLEMLRRVDSALLHATGSSERMHFHPAPEVSRGGCLLKTRFGIIDAQRETKLELIKQAVLA